METKTRQTPDLRPDRMGRPDVLELHQHLNSSQGRVVVLSREDVQAIVQQAYDQHGIVAQLWTDGARDTPTCDGTLACPSTRHHIAGCIAAAFDN